MNKKIIKFFVCISAVFVLTACANKANMQSADVTESAVTDRKENESLEMKNGEYIKISAKEAKDIMDSKKDYIIADVRSEDEYKEGHIKGAVLIPNETINDTVTEKLPDKDRLILVYCRSGNRSEQAAKKLIELGYTNVKDFGGIKDWTYEIEK